MKVICLKVMCSNLKVIINKVVWRSKVKVYMICHQKDLQTLFFISQLNWTHSAIVIESKLHVPRHKLHCFYKGYDAWLLWSNGWMHANTEGIAYISLIANLCVEVHVALSFNNRFTVKCTWIPYPALYMLLTYGTF